MSRFQSTENLPRSDDWWAWRKVKTCGWLCGFVEDV